MATKTSKQKDNAKAKDAKVSKAVNRKIFELQALLSGSDVTEDLMKDCMEWFQVYHLNEVIEERVVTGRCGNPSCNHRLAARVNQNQKSYFKIDYRKKTLDEVEYIDDYCSKDCQDKTFAVRDGLSTDPPVLRPVAKSLVVNAPQKDTERTSNDAGDDDGIDGIDAILELLSIAEGEVGIEPLPAVPKGKRMSRNTVDSSDEKVDIIYPPLPSYDSDVLADNGKIKNMESIVRPAKKQPQTGEGKADATLATGVVSSGEGSASIKGPKKMNFAISSLKPFTRGDAAPQKTDKTDSHKTIIADDQKKHEPPMSSSEPKKFDEKFAVTILKDAKVKPTSHPLTGKPVVPRKRVSFSDEVKPATNAHKSRDPTVITGHCGNDDRKGHRVHVSREDSEVCNEHASDWPPSQEELDCMEREWDEEIRSASSTKSTISSLNQSTKSSMKSSSVEENTCAENERNIGNESGPKHAKSGNGSAGGINTTALERAGIDVYTKDQRGSQIESVASEAHGASDQSGAASVANVDTETLSAKSKKRIMKISKGPPTHCPPVREHIIERQPGAVSNGSTTVDAANRVDPDIEVGMSDIASKMHQSLSPKGTSRSAMSSVTGTSNTSTTSSINEMIEASHPAKQREAKGIQRSPQSGRSGLNSHRATDATMAKHVTEKSLTAPISPGSGVSMHNKNDNQRKKTNSGKSTAEKKAAMLGGAVIERSPSGPLPVESILSKRADVAPRGVDAKDVAGRLVEETSAKPENAIDNAAGTMSIEGFSFVVADPSVVPAASSQSPADAMGSSSAQPTSADAEIHSKKVSFDVDKGVNPLDGPTTTRPAHTTTQSMAVSSSPFGIGTFQENLMHEMNGQDVRRVSETGSQSMHASEFGGVSLGPSEKDKEIWREIFGKDYDEYSTDEDDADYDDDSNTGSGVGDGDEQKNEQLGNNNAEELAKGKPQSRPENCVESASRSGSQKANHAGTSGSHDANENAISKPQPEKKRLFPLLWSALESILEDRFSYLVASAVEGSHTQSSQLPAASIASHASKTGSSAIEQMAQRMIVNGGTTGGAVHHDESDFVNEMNPDHDSSTIASGALTRLVERGVHMAESTLQLTSILSTVDREKRALYYKTKVHVMGGVKLRKSGKDIDQKGTNMPSLTSTEWNAVGLLLVDAIVHRTLYSDAGEASSENVAMNNMNNESEPGAMPASAGVHQWHAAVAAAAERVLGSQRCTEDSNKEGGALSDFMLLRRYFI